MNENKVFRGYYFIVLGTFLVVLSTAVILSWLQFQNRYAFEESQIKRQIQENLSQLNTIVSIVRSNLLSMQSETQFYLNHPEALPEHPLLEYVSSSEDSTYFHLDQAPDSLKAHIGNITGIHAFEQLSPLQKHEISISLHSNSLLKSALNNTPNVVLVYSSFDNSFVNLFPYMPSSEFRVTQEVFDHFKVYYADVFPDKNPEREVKWSPIYPDETGKGFMVSAVVPFYQGNHYLGLGGIDMTLDSLNKIITTSQPQHGEIYLVNDKKQLLAHPSLVSSGQEKILPSSEAIPEAIRELAGQLNHWEENEIHQVKDYLLYYAPVPGTSWQLVYTVNIWETYLSIFLDIGIGTLFILISISIVLFITALYTRKRFIRPAQALVEHIQRENHGQNHTGYIPPRQWKPWFGIISDIFQSNRTMIQELKSQNDLLEQKVIERTSEIAAQNEELIQNQEEITTQRDYIDSKNQELLHINERLKANEFILTTANEKLSESQQKISQKNHELEVRDKQIRSSINAALSIQSAILPYPHRMKTLLGEHFVIYKPKDIVSGDFYWIHTVGDYRILVAADCTGHGVPGALMSMIGNTVLDKVISQKRQTHPSKILESVHEEVLFSLKQKETHNNNGMDMSILVMEPYGKGLTLARFAGAKSSMFFKYPHEKEVTEVKGSRRAIGGYQNLNTPFETREIILNPGTLIYMGSDGYVDQNNVHRKRLGEKAFRCSLSEISCKPLSEQKALLEERLEAHMAGTKQRDDIMLIGFQL